MKKLIHLFLIISSVMFLNSCTINSDFVFHKDKTTTFAIEVEFKGEPSEKNDNAKTDKIPTQWTSVYDLAKQEGKEIPADSVEFAKKIFVKSILKDQKTNGFGLRFERMSDEDFEKLKNSNDKNQQMASQMTQSSLSWDGENLIIDTEKLFNSTNSEDTSSKEKKKDKKKNSESDFGEMLTKAIDIQLNIKMNFENDIKKIKGKHTHFKQTGKKSVEFNFDLSDPKNDKKNDKKIIIQT